MNADFLDGKTLGWMSPLLLIVAMSACMPAVAHDPLHDEDGTDHDEHYYDDSPEHGRDSHRLVDLTAVRSLVVSFRETGDDRRLNEAWALLAPAIAAEFPDPQTLIVAAYVAQSRHDFAHALQFIETALAMNRNIDEAWLLLASIHLVRGDTVQAAKSCRQLRRVPIFVSLTCKARVALVSGDQRMALIRLVGVLNIVDEQHTPVEMLAWSYSVAGDLAVASGEVQQGGNLYTRSLALAERTQVRAALVDVLLSRGNNEDAWRTLDAGSQALPLVVRRLIAAKRLDRLSGLEAVLIEVQREFERWLTHEDWLHAREMTRFYIDVVDRPDIARRLALININVQREPEDLRLESRTRS